MKFYEGSTGGLFLGTTGAQGLNLGVTGSYIINIGRGPEGATAECEGVNDCIIRMNDIYIDPEDQDNVITDKCSYGENWGINSSISENWTSISMSGSGQYQTVISNNIYVSSNYGESWMNKNSLSSLKSVSLSTTGQYQIVCKLFSSLGDIWISSDYGNNWSNIQIEITSTYLYSTGISSTGQYQIIGGFIGSSSLSKVYVSSNYGQTWNDIILLSVATSIYVSISSTGQFQTAVAFSDFIYISSDFGKSWVLSPTQPTSKSWSSVSVSSTGQFQTAVASGDFIYISSDFGKSWILSPTQPTSKSWSSVSVSSTGQYQSAVNSNDIYLSYPNYNLYGEFYLSSSNITLGKYSGETGQGVNAIAIGVQAGQSNQGSNSVAIGVQSGVTGQQANSVAIGNQAGQSNQGSNSIAIGNLAGVNNQRFNSIILNATGSLLDNSSISNSTFIAPIRNISTSNYLLYNSSTKEVTYGTTGPNFPYGLYLNTGGANGLVYNSAGSLITYPISGPIFVYFRFQSVTSYGGWVASFSGSGTATRLQIPFSGLYSISFFSANTIVSDVEIFISKNAGNNTDTSYPNPLAIAKTQESTVSVSTFLNAGDYINFGIYVPGGIQYTSFGRDAAYINLIYRT
jgi:hypothetical protein